MKYDVEKYSDVEVQSTTIDNDITLSNDSTGMIFQIFTKNMYSNPIGSIVREITSNCFDSHIEANLDIKKVPVVIRKTFDNVTNTHYISFIDYGVGMSPDRIKNVFSVMFSSSKRQDDRQIGAFGLGSKVPLAYRRSTGLGEEEYDNSYSIITKFAGIQYTYQIYDSNKCPKISEPLIEFTKEDNGTEVRIPVLEKDIQTFKREMVRQLYYFENIIFDGFVDDENKTQTEEVLTNDFQIVRGKSFFFRGSEYERNVHVCLGRVAYPIDYNALGLNSGDYRFPIAIKLEIGEISITPSRESLNYNEATIKILKKKLETAKAEVISMLVKQYDDIQTLEDYFKVKNKFGMLYMPNGGCFNVGDIVKMKDVSFNNFKFNFMKMPNDKQLFRYFFEAKSYGKKIRTSRSWRYNNNDDESGFEAGYDALMDKNSNLYYCEGEFQRKIVKQAWLKQKHNTYFIIGKKNIVDRFQSGLVADLFNVSDALVDGNDEPTPYMKTLLELQDEYYELVRRQCTDYNSVVVPQDYIDSRKANAKKLSEEFRNATIPVRLVGRYSSRVRVKLDALFNLNVPIFYGSNEDEYTIRDAKNTFTLLFGDDLAITSYSEYNNVFSMQKKKGILFLELGKNNVRYMEYCKNAKPISEFKSVYIHRKEDAVKEYFQSRNFIERFENINDLYTSKEFTMLSPDWNKKVNIVADYISKTNKNSNDWSHSRSELSRIYNLENIKPTKEQQYYVKIIAELEEMQELNKDVLRFIDVPYQLGDAPQVFWDLLKKVLVY